MTPGEYALVSAVVTSCFLSFLIPQCHYIGFLHAYFAPTTTSNNWSSKSRPVPWQPLEERIDESIASRGAFPYSASRMRSLVDDDDGFTTSAFHRFLDEGLSSYVSSGKAFIAFVGEGGSQHDQALRVGADLLQLLAMAICPQLPNTSNVPRDVSKKLSLEAGDESSYQSTLNVMTLAANSTFPYSFQLSYSDRLQLVKLCAEKLVVHEQMTTGKQSQDAQRLAATLAMLRTSLVGFASCTARSEDDAIVAYNALTNIVIREGKLTTIQFAFRRMLSTCMDSTSPHLVSAIGGCLSDLIVKYNGSRFYADGVFTRDTIVFVAKCIDERTPLPRDNEEAASNKDQLIEETTTAKRRKTTCRPCHLLVLLRVARYLYGFLLESDTIQASFAESMSTLELIGSATILIGYPYDLAVVKSAAQLVALSLSYNEKFVQMATIRNIFIRTKASLNNWKNDANIVDALHDLIITVSRQSETFAFNLTSYIVKACSLKELSKTSVWKMVALLSSVQPDIVSRLLSNLDASISDASEADITIQQIKTLLCCGMATNGAARSATTQACVALSKAVSSHWTLFQLVRHAFATSSFGFAQHILNACLLEKCTSRNNFLWLQSLSKMASAEESLRANGALGISDALMNMSSCYSTISSLDAISEIQPISIFQFQQEFIKARLYFLHLCKTTRLMCTEIIVTGDAASYSRSALIRNNLHKSFRLLSSRYMQMYRLHGLHHCQQTRSALRTLLAACRLLSDFVELVFSKPEANANNTIVVQEDVATQPPTGDKGHPMGLLLRRLRDGALAKMEASSEPPLFLTPELVDVIDAILMCPVHFPPAFLRAKIIPRAYAKLAENPSSFEKRAGTNMDDAYVSMDANGVEIIEILPGVTFKLVFSGVIPKAFIRSAAVDFSQVIAWHTLAYEGQIVEEDDAEEVNINEVSPALDNAASEPFTASLLPDGAFIMQCDFDPIPQEGYYRVKIELGCRDVRCGEWIVPTKDTVELVLCVRDKRVLFLEKH